VQPPANHARALLRILSFNVRFHGHDHPPGADGRPYPCDERRDLLLSIIRDLDPDVTGLQEVRDEQQDYLSGNLSDQTFLIMWRGDGGSARTTTRECRPLVPPKSINKKNLRRPTRSGPAPQGLPQPWWRGHATHQKRRPGFAGRRSGQPVWS
jgi:hypothetical protein